LRANDQNDRAGASDGNKEVSGLVGVPAFQGGGRVERTGIALVHEGEYVLPALGAEAVIAPENAGQVINYYFPVQIEIVGTLNEQQLKRVAEYMYADLHTELDSRGLP
jgi:hypothetical protein